MGSAWTSSNEGVQKFEQATVVVARVIEQETMEQAFFRDIYIS